VSKLLAVGPLAIAREKPEGARGTPTRVNKRGSILGLVRPSGALPFPPIRGGNWPSMLVFR